MTDTQCVVFLCNQAYFPKFIKTCTELVTVGKYRGPICLVIGNDLVNSPLLQNSLIQENNIIIKHFPDIEFPADFINIQRAIPRPPHWFQKIFQYHKLHLFNTYFKQWDYIFYIDCGITIFSDITPMFESRKKDKLLAHSDAYPTYRNKLGDQFSNHFQQYRMLQSTFNLNIDYFQTTIMLYDTSIIQVDTFDNLRNLLFIFPISITNDQGLIALYFTNVRPHFEQIQIQNTDTDFYDYLSRNKSYKYIMLKIC
jgi:hypothetical protein